MDDIGYRRNKNHSKTNDNLNSLRRGSTTVTRSYDRPSPSSKGALRESREQTRSTETQLSRSFSERTGVLCRPCPNDPMSKLSLSPRLRGCSNFVPMDSRALGASIKREETWSKRRRSPSRKPHRPPSMKFSACESTMADEAEVNKCLSQDDEFSLLDDLDELGASDDEDTKSFLLGVSTPTTLRGRKLRMSLYPVHESQDDDAKENCESDHEAN